MSTGIPNPDNQPEKDVSKRQQVDSSESNVATGRRRSPVPLILVAILVVLALIGAVALITRGGNEDMEGASEAPQPQLTSTAPEIIKDSYVDDAGQQEEELTPVPESHEDINDIALQMSIGMAPVDLVGLTNEGALIPPEDVSRLGWYAASAIPGDPNAKGSTVITGHVNHQTQGQGFAYYFTQLEQGDEVSVLIDGTTHTYRVTKPPFRASKEGALPEEVNDSTGENKLVLITCGGEFVGGSLGYADNVFVIAEPI